MLPGRIYILNIYFEILHHTAAWSLTEGLYSILLPHSIHDEDGDGDHGDSDGDGDGEAGHRTLLNK